MTRWMLIRRLLAVMTAVITVGAMGEDATTPPKSRAAQVALTRHDQAMRKADQEYQRAAIAAKKALVAELEQAKAQAMQAGQLDEANAIAATLVATQVELARLNGRVELSVDAGPDWKDSSIYLRSGQSVKVTARGTWCAGIGNREKWMFGPEGDGNGMFHLVAKIGEGSVIPVGAGRVIKADADGQLFFRMRDTRYADNDGSLQVVIAMQ